jgi:hypothetical protein
VLPFVKSFINPFSFCSEKRLFILCSLFSIMSLMNKVVGISIALFVAAYILPLALVALSNDTALTGVDPSVVTMVQVLIPIIGVVAIILYMLPRKG